MKRRHAAEHSSQPANGMKMVQMVRYRRYLTERRDGVRDSIVVGM